MKSSFKPRIKGFSLTEVIVVVVIIGLLAAVAVPAYKKFSGRSKMIDAVKVIQRQLDIYAEKTLLGQNPSTTISPAGNYIKSIVVTPSNVVATLDKNTLTFLASDLPITFTPTQVNNTTTWIVTYPTGPSYADYFPANYLCASCS